MSNELVLAVLPGATQRERLLMVMSATPGAALALVQQSWSETTGWFNQTSIELAPEQVAQLRASLGRGGAASRAAAPAPAWSMPQRNTGSQRSTTPQRNASARTAQKTGAAEATPAILSLSEFRRAESA